jgi:subtilisin family serine protease
MADMIAEFTIAKLNAPLQVALAEWQADREQARDGDLRYGTQTAVERRHVAILVRFEGDAQPLRDSGMAINHAAGGVARGAIGLADIERLASLPGVTSIALRPTPHLELDRSVPETRAPLVWSAPVPFKGAGVIVAVVDTGIDIFHASFQQKIQPLSPPKTRILRIWDQGLLIPGKTPPRDATGTAYGTGVEFTQDEINAALAGDPSDWKHKDTDGHGTHVAGIAAGNGQQHDGCTGPGKYIGVAPEADLVIIRALRLGGVGNSDTDAALRYAIDFAASIPKPIVVNKSFGFHIGPHDGTEASELFINDQVFDTSTGAQRPGIAVVKSAGNEGADDIHNSGNIAANGALAITFHVDPAGRPDRTRDQFNIWYDLLASINFRLQLPDGNTSGTASPSPSPTTLPLVSGHRIVVSSRVSEAGSLKNNITVSVTPPAGGTMQTGPWQILLNETSGVATAVNLWIDTEHDDGYPTFRAPGVAPGTTAALRVYSVSMPGYARHAIVAGAYDDADGRMAPTSSWGPLLPANPTAPDVRPSLTAPGRGIYAAKSRHAGKRPCCVCCPDHHVNKSGSSMAAPHVTGAIALMFEKNPGLTTDQIRLHLMETARTDGIPVAEIPPVINEATDLRGNHMWGAGKLDVAAAVAAVPARSAAVTPSGGGGGAPSITRDEPAPHASPFDRLRAWQDAFAGRPAFQLCAALISTHVDEVRRLIDTNRRVATIWHRNGGPLLVRQLLALEPPDATLPRGVGGHDISTLLERLLAICARYGSENLRADIARYGALMLALPGRRVTELDALIVPEPAAAS